MPRPLRTINRHQRPIERARKTSSEEAERIKISTTLLFEQKGVGNCVPPAATIVFHHSGSCSNFAAEFAAGRVYEPEKKANGPACRDVLEAHYSRARPQGTQDVQQYDDEDRKPRLSCQKPHSSRVVRGRENNTGRTIQ
jgi:hypothetical protein